MKIDEHYDLTADTNGYSLTCTRHGDTSQKTGVAKVSLKVTYHATLAQAMQAYVEREVRHHLATNDLADFHSLMVELRRVEVKVLTFIEEVASHVNRQNCLTL